MGITWFHCIIKTLYLLYTKERIQTIPTTISRLFLEKVCLGRVGFLQCGSTWREVGSWWRDQRDDMLASQIMVGGPSTMFKRKQPRPHSWVAWEVLVSSRGMRGTGEAKWESNSGARSTGSISASSTVCRSTDSHPSGQWGNGALEENALCMRPVDPDVRREELGRGFCTRSTSTESLSQVQSQQRGKWNHRCMMYAGTSGPPQSCSRVWLQTIKKH